MGIESLRAQETFGLEELGLLDTSPFRPVDVLVDLCVETLRAPIVAFVVFDEDASSLLVRSVFGSATVRPGVLAPATVTSASALVRDETKLVSISDLDSRSDTAQAVERARFGAVGFLGAPVYGPIQEVVGVLAAMTKHAHFWSKRERDVLGDYAFLMTEQIMLRAAMETVKLMARQHGPTDTSRSAPN